MGRNLGKHVRSRRALAPVEAATAITAALMLKRRDRDLELDGARENVRHQFEQVDTADEARTDSLYADAIRTSFFTPAVERFKGPPPRKPVTTFEQVMKDLDEARKDSWEEGGSGRPLIYLDSSVALAVLLDERRAPPSSFCQSELVSSRPLEYEIWNGVNVRGLARSHSESAAGLRPG